MQYRSVVRQLARVGVSMAALTFLTVAWRRLPLRTRAMLQPLQTKSSNA